MMEQLEYDMEFYWFWLCNIPRIGNVKIKALLNFFENPKQVYEVEMEGGLDKAKEYLSNIKGITKDNVNRLLDKDIKNKAKAEYDRIKALGIKITTIDSDDYPKKLKEIFDAPYILYYRGKLPDSRKKSVAIVGSRNCSEYGRSIAKSIALQLAGFGVQIISGFARGVDTAAHNGCLEAKGETTAVFGCGINICYPVENKFTYTEIIENNGCIMSEFFPNTEPVAGLFPLRNRIISGLADLVIVVEAGNKSGSLITVDHALEQNKTVMAVPGRVTDRLSEGCNNLIKQGAAMVSKVEDILFELGINYDKNANIGKKNKFELATPEKMLYSLVDFIPIYIDEIVNKSSLPPKEVMKYLMEMELKGCIKEVGKNYYVRNE